MAALPSVACLDPATALQPDIAAKAPTHSDQPPQLPGLIEFQRASVILQSHWRARITRRRYLALVRIIRKVQRAWRSTLTKRRCQTLPPPVVGPTRSQQPGSGAKAQPPSNDKLDHTFLLETASAPLAPFLALPNVSTSPLPHPLVYAADSPVQPASCPMPTPVPPVTEPRRSLRSSARLTSNTTPSSGSDTQGAGVPERPNDASQKKQTKSPKPVRSAADLESLSVAELRQLTSANTQRNKRYRHCSLDLVIVHKDCPRPESPELGPSDAGDPDDGSQKIESIDDVHVSLPPLAPASSHTRPMAFSITDGIGDTLLSAGRQIRWHAQLIATSLDTDQTCAPDLAAPPPSRSCLKAQPLCLARDDQVSTSTRADSAPSHGGSPSTWFLPHSTSPQAVTKVCVQRFIYTDDDLNDPEVIEELTSRNKAYEQVYETTAKTDQGALSNAMAVDIAGTTLGSAHALASVDTVPSLDHLFVHTLQLTNVTSKVLKKPTRSSKRRKKSR